MSPCRNGNIGSLAKRFAVRAAGPADSIFGTDGERIGIPTARILAPDIKSVSTAANSVTSR
jgi:hypothetical protein